MKYKKKTLSIREINKMMGDVKSPYHLEKVNNEIVMVKNGKLN